MTMSPDQPGYVSRAGAKLAFALDHFAVNPTGLICVDLGSNVGGFVDCLLRRNARKVYAVDTGYGTLDWSLRRDDRVVVLERTNALDIEIDEPAQLVTVDVGWTRQHLILPRALDLVEPSGTIISLIKPHYEADRRQLRKGVLPDEQAGPTLNDTIERLADLGVKVERTIESPIRGDAGNREWLALIRSTAPSL
jgi:23S rRNA (cytidine1920-2'-O)/16S rRNA (cytidine1409-2'-O)-methyltransferase